jgi:hypothetical protein
MKLIILQTEYATTINQFCKPRSDDELLTDGHYLGKEHIKDSEMSAKKTRTYISLLY